MKAMMKRVFLDASALFAAAYSPAGAARELIRLGIEKQLLLFTNQTAIEETERNLARKAPEGLAVLRALLAVLPIDVLPAPTPAEFEQMKFHVVAKDAPILAGALACRADYLATFDRQHLIGLDARRAAPGLRILTPGDILAQLREA